METAAACLESKVVLSPLVKLEPEEVTFSKPVKLVMPACAGATTAFRSSSGTWSEVPMKFEDGEVQIILDHFCEVLVAGESRPLKAMGFIKETPPMAKLSILHVGCTSCNRSLEVYKTDDDMLQHFLKCQDAPSLGDYFDNDPDHLVYGQDDGLCRVPLRFCRLPIVSSGLRSSPCEFEVVINDRRLRFASYLGSASFFLDVLLPGQDLELAQISSKIMSRVSIVMFKTCQDLAAANLRLCQEELLVELPLPVLPLPEFLCMLVVWILSVNEVPFYRGQG